MVLGIANGDVPRVMDHHHRSRLHYDFVARHCDDRRNRRRKPVDMNADIALAVA